MQKTWDNTDASGFTIVVVDLFKIHFVLNYESNFTKIEDDDFLAMR